MASSYCQNRGTGRTLLTLFVAAVLLCQGCSKQPENDSFDPAANAPSSFSASACIDVHGKVLGDIKPNTNVSLYRTPSVEYAFVVSTIRTNHPVGSARINESNGFSFNCLTYGNYAFAIPTSSYISSVGFPLPYEFDCENFSLRIAFQGGDYQYAVGAFSIDKVESNSIRGGTWTALSAKRRPLYKGCPETGGKATS